MVCQHPNGADVAYANSDGFGHPGMIGLWDLHANHALNWAKLVLKSRVVDANFCPLCAFWSTNNKALGGHVQKHYNMGLTCQVDGFTMASISALKKKKKGKA